MVCPKCKGSGRDLAALAITVKVPGVPHYKLMQPCCAVCGGTGEKFVENEEG